MLGWLWECVAGQVIWHETCKMKCITCDMTCMTCHMTCMTCHMTCHMTWEIRYNFKLSWWIVRKIRRVSDVTRHAVLNIMSYDMWHGMTWHSMSWHGMKWHVMTLHEIKWNKTWDMNFDFLLTYEQVRMLMTCDITCHVIHVMSHMSCHLTCMTCHMSLDMWHKV